MKLKILKDRLFSITKYHILTWLIIFATFCGGYILGIFSERSSQRELRTRASAEREELQKRTDYIIQKIQKETNDFNDAVQMWNNYWHDTNSSLQEK